MRIGKILLLLLLLLLLLTLGLSGCESSEFVPAQVSKTETEFAFSTPRSIDPPAAQGAMAPELGFGAGGPLLTWLEQRDDGGHMLLLSSLEGEHWQEPLEIASGEGFFANWADRPGAFAGEKGLVAAHWLEKLGTSTYAYGVRLEVSTDEGERWQDVGLLHDDASETEHGFVSYVAEREMLRAFWLDGRAMAGGEPMQLRTALIGARGAQDSEMLDERVCECCATAAAMTSQGAVVAYRDRSEQEIRDIHIVRQTGTDWSEPTLVYADGWVIPGCPVNGPAIAANGESVAIAWFTGAGEGSRIQVAFSTDAGATFGPPILLDGETPVGRVDLELDEGGEAFVSWIGSEGEIASVRLARVRNDGQIVGPTAIAESSESRSSGVPRMARYGESLILVWVDPDGGGRIRAASVDLR